MNMTHRWMIVSWVCIFIGAGHLSGCASAPSPLIKLQEARVTLERAREAETPDTHASIQEAAGALAYAENEYRLSPGHPLSQERAETALRKARNALEVTTAARRLNGTAH